MSEHIHEILKILREKMDFNRPLYPTLDFAAQVEEYIKERGLVTRYGNVLWSIVSQRIDRNDHSQSSEKWALLHAKAEDRFRAALRTLEGR